MELGLPPKDKPTGLVVVKTPPLLIIGKAKAAKPATFGLGAFTKGAS